MVLRVGIQGFGAMACNASTIADQQPPDQIITSPPTPPLLLISLKGRRALAAVHVVILLLDSVTLLEAGVAMQHRDIDVAAMAVKEGKGLVIALTKSDLIPGGADAAERLRVDVAAVLEKKFTEVGKLPVVMTAALKNEGTELVMGAAAEAYVRWNKRWGGGLQGRFVVEAVMCGLMVRS